MTLPFDAVRQPREFSTLRISAACTALAAISIAQSSFAQPDTKPPEDQPPIILNKPLDPAMDSESDMIVEPGRIQLKPAKIGAPAGVIIAAPDEEIIIEGAPKIDGKPESPDAPPAIRRKIRIEKGDKKAEADIEQRLARMERMIEKLVEREKVSAFAFNDKEFSRLQKDLNRATREADIAVKRLEKGHPEFGKNFTFEHKIAVAGNAKAQRKALEAQRKALQKQMEAIDKRLESLENAPDEDNNEKLEEHESEVTKESSTTTEKE